MKRRRLAATCGLLIAGHAWAAAPARPAPCPPPVEAEPASGPLPHLAGALKPGGSLDILAVGGGPAGRLPGPVGVPPNSGGFASQIAHALQAAVPGLQVTITLQGGSFRGAAAQLDIIRAALKAHRYQMVLWQTGTVEAVNDEPADDFYQALSDGVQAAAEHGADMVLVEPQYSRFLEANANVSPYLSVMQAVSALPGTLLFHRYALMHDWVDAGLIDLEAVPAADRPATAARLRACLGAELARALLTEATGSQD
jgi:hypothetical protein